MMTDRSIAWHRPTGDLEEQRPTVPYSWYGWGTVNMRRWQYTPPWGCTRWALPHVQHFRGGDEYCNSTLLVQAPFLGHVIFWKPWGRLRTAPCDECVADGAAREVLERGDSGHEAEAVEGIVETTQRFCPTCGEWLDWPAEWPPHEEARGNDQYGGLLNLPPHDCQPQPRAEVERRFGFDA